MGKFMSVSAAILIAAGFSLPAASAAPVSTHGKSAHSALTQVKSGHKSHKHGHSHKASHKKAK